MHIAVVIAGIADPRRPLERPASGKWTDLGHTATTPFKCSPFDEAALESALKLRDKDATVFITAIVTDGAQDLAFLRAVAALRPDRVLGLYPPEGQRGNPAWLASHLMQTAQLPGQPVDLVLIGREHGDLDDGMLPPFVAERCGLSFVGLASRVRMAEAGGWIAERSTRGMDEFIALPAPACVSISNDKSNRLRHPLMKNVMQAKQLGFTVLRPDSVAGCEGAHLIGAAPPSPALRGAAPCRILQGTVREQAAELSSILKARKYGPATHAG